MIEFSIRSSYRRPTYKPALERLESRLVLTMMTYTNYAVVITDWDTGQTFTATATFTTDTADQTIVGGTQTAIANWGATLDENTQMFNAWLPNPDASSAPDMATVTNQLDQSCGIIDGFWNEVMNLNNGYGGQPPMNTTSSVTTTTATDTASARTRGMALMNQANSINAKIKAMQQDVESSGFLDSISKSYDYRPQLSKYTQQVKDITAELKIIKQKFPDAFK